MTEVALYSTQVAVYCISKSTIAFFYANPTTAVTLTYAVASTVKHIMGNWKQAAKAEADLKLARVTKSFEQEVSHLLRDKTDLQTKLREAQEQLSFKPADSEPRDRAVHNGSSVDTMFTTSPSSSPPPPTPPAAVTTPPPHTPASVVTTPLPPQPPLPTAKPKIKPEISSKRLFDCVRSLPRDEVEKISPEELQFMKVDDMKAWLRYNQIRVINVQKLSKLMLARTLADLYCDYQSTHGYSEEEERPLKRQCTTDGRGQFLRIMGDVYDRTPIVIS